MSMIAVYAGGLRFNTTDDLTYGTNDKPTRNWDSLRWL